MKRSLPRTTTEEAKLEESPTISLCSAKLCSAKWSTVVNDSTAQSVVPFSRRRNTCMSAFDELRNSGHNGVFNPVPIQLLVKEEDICELCAPLEKATIGVICTGCQAMLDDGLAEIVKIPAHLMVPEYNHLLDKNSKVKETTWTEKTTN